MRWLLTPRGRWYALAAFWGVMLVLGIGGFLQQAHDAGISRSNLDTLYLTLQLVTLDYGEDHGLNWRLEVARFIAPLVAAGTILQALSVVFRDEFSRFRMRFLSDHTVVIGLGAVGTRVALALAAEGQAVVGVDRDGDSGIGSLRGHDLLALKADARDASTLSSVRLGAARQVVVACGDDAANVAVAQGIRAIERSARRPALRCAVQLSDAELCALLRGGDLAAAGAVRLDFFNIHERAATALLATYSPFAAIERPPHLVVEGLGQLGRSLVVAAARQWADISPGQPLRLTLVDRVATGRWEALRLQHPALGAACTVTTLDLDLDEPHPGTADRFEAALRDGPTWVAVLFDDESVALSAALLTRRTMPDETVPLIVRTHSNAGIGALLDLAADSSSPAVHVFPFLERACTPSVVSGGVREQLARALHDQYLTRGATGALSVPWDDLTDEQRESSRRAADDQIAAFHAVGFDLVPLRRWGDSTVALTDDEVEVLSAREHSRWLAERRADGWTYGAVRDDATKTNPLLVEWTELDPVAQDQQRAATRATPALLGQAGFEPLRRTPQPQPS